MIKSRKIFPRLLMIVGAVILLGLYVLPLWNITLEAPQYPDSIGMDIYIDSFKGVNDNDIKNINIMNHYIGMKEIPEVIPEFRVFSYVVMGMIIAGILFGLFGNRYTYLLWLVTLVIFCTIAMYDFYLWEYKYGNDLNLNAAIKFTDEQGNPMAYQPPLIGSKVILNFKAISMPRVGAALIFFSMLFSGFAFWNSKSK